MPLFFIPARYKIQYKLKTFTKYTPHSMQQLYFAQKLGNSPRLTQESYEELEWLVTGNCSIECWYCCNVERDGGH